MSKQLNTKEASINKSLEKVRKFDSQIDDAYNNHDLTEVDNLLEKQHDQITRLHELRSEYADIKADYYTTPDGMNELKKSIAEANTPGQKAKLVNFLKENEAIRESQRHSYNLYQKAKKNRERPGFQPRLQQLSTLRNEYLKKHKEGAESSRERLKYQTARDRVRLAELGNMQAVALRSRSLKDMVRENKDNTWDEYYAEVPNESLVSDSKKYFPYGNPLEKVSNVVKEGEGYAVELESGRRIRTGVLMSPIYVSR